MFRTALVLASVTVSPLAVLTAQDQQVLTSGTRVRVTTASEIYEGDMIRVQDDSIRLQVPGVRAPVAVPRSRITEIAVSAGRHSNTGTGAKVGFLVGATAGVLMFEGLSAP